MRRQIIIFSAVLVTVAGSVFAACDCEPLDSYFCQLYPQACEDCWAECEPARHDPRRSLGPPRQPGVDYNLQRQVGMWSIDYGPNDLAMTNTIRRDGFHVVNLWTDTVPYCPGHNVNPFTWVTDEPGCAAQRFWEQTPAKQIHIRFHAWADTEGNDEPNACRITTRTPVGFLVYRLYEMIWWKDITVVITPWEQGWYSLGCWACPELEHCCPESGDGPDCSWEQKRIDYMIRQDRLVYRQEIMQWDVIKARALMLQRYPHAKLNVLLAMTVNKSGGYNIPGRPPRYSWTEGLPTLAERIRGMCMGPDLVGVSYYVYGVDPAVVLDSISEDTGYPPSRMFIAEFGGKTPEEQVQRFSDYVPAFWDWGIRTVLAWIYYMPVGCVGCAPEKWLLTEDALDTIRQLNTEAITWGRGPND